MSLGTLYQRPGTKADLCVAIVKHFDLDVEIKLGSPDDETYTKAFPLKLVPGFITPDGEPIHEVIAVMHYLATLIEDEDARGKLVGANTLEQIRVLKWESLVVTDLGSALITMLLMHIQKLPFNKKMYEYSLARFDMFAGEIERRLQDYTYLATEEVTLADICACSIIHIGCTLMLGAEWRAAHPAISRWLKTLNGNPLTKSLVPLDNIVEKPVSVVPQKQQATKQKQEPKKEAKKQSKKEAPEEEEEEAKPKPAKHPLAALPKATFALDSWKSKYSNEETRSVALPWFWEHFNPEEYSIWKVSYKYNDELTLTFMSNNLIGGFFNRLSASIKFMFGCLVVFGENNDNGIIGAIMVRGQEFAPAFEVAPDWESYDYLKLDPLNAEDKAFIENMWAWDQPVVVNGKAREIADGKVLK